MSPSPPPSLVTGSPIMFLYRHCSLPLLPRTTDPATFENLPSPPPSRPRPGPLRHNFRPHPSLCLYSDITAPGSSRLRENRVQKGKQESRLVVGTACKIRSSRTGTAQMRTCALAPLWEPWLPHIKSFGTLLPRQVPHISLRAYLVQTI